MLGSHSANDAVVIGLFSYASDARRAFLMLRERQFPPNEIAAAFEEPGRAPGDNHHWFGQLRQLYHGERSTEQPDSVQSMFGNLDLAPPDIAILERDLKRGGAVVTVRSGSRNQEARTLLEERGARIVHAQGVTQPEAGLERVTSSAAFPPPPAEPGHIQLFGEVLRVHKEKVDSGEVHVRKEAVTRMETIEVPVTEEHLVVEHPSQNGPSTGPDVVRIPLSKERLHIDKETVLRDEYKVGKREVTQNQAVTDSVRKERLLIDDAEAAGE
jgi:uncharacterized protein (TIGR02271 family)